MCAVLIENGLTNVINVYFSYALPRLFRRRWNPTFSTEFVSYVADVSVIYLSHFWKHTKCLKLVVPIGVCVCVLPWNASGLINTIFAQACVPSSLMLWEMQLTRLMQHVSRN